MNMLIDAMFIFFMCYCSFKWGAAAQKAAISAAAGEAGIRAIVDRATFPVTVAEKIEGQYYLYEKDSTNFLGQAPTLEELPRVMFVNKKITLALLLCPEEYDNQQFWCINGKLKKVEW